MFRLFAILLLGFLVVFTLMQPNACDGQGDVLSIVAIEGVHQQFGNENTRTVTQEVTFPDAEMEFSQVVLKYTLSCPDGGCDPWDRLANLYIVKHAGTNEEESYEIARFITPYGVGGSWQQDVTDLRPLLTGTQTFRSFVDTWTSPGWIVDVVFDFYVGKPEQKAVEVRQLWLQTVLYGDPVQPIENQVLEHQEVIPSNITGAKLRILNTGHGQGNAENCAEFCPKEHTFVINGTSNTETLWRDDCVRTAVKGQHGTWWFSRAGWCPGADVIPRIWDIGSLIHPNEVSIIQYAIQPYENTCRPDYEPECTGCMSFVTSCDYNGGDHTPPVWKLSAQLILFASE